MPKKLLEINGIITVLNTPFTKNNEIDTVSLERNIEYAISSGIAGILVPAKASEVDKLTLKERHVIINTVVKKVNNRIPVIGGASSDNIDESIQLSKSIIDSGCNGVLINIPYTSEMQFMKDVQAIATTNPEFLMIQDWDFNGYGIPADTIVKLFDTIECFKSYKIEVVPAGVKYSEIIKKTNGCLHVAGGWAVMQMIEALDRGVHAFMPTGMHELFTMVYNLYHNDKRSDAVLLFIRMLPILAFATQHLDISIHFLKKLLYKQGIYETANVRKPILPFDKYHDRIADEIIEYTIDLINHYNKQSNI